MAEALLEELLQGLAAGTLSPEALGEGLRELARWRLACGDLPAAARLQRLALSPEPRAVLEALRPQGGEQAWEQLLRLLHRGQYRQAAALQQTLLEGGQGGPAGLQEAALWAWLQAGWGEQALALADGLLRWPAGEGGLGAVLAAWRQQVTESQASAAEGGSSTDPS